MTNDKADVNLPPSPSTPHTRLRALDTLLGTWSLEHRAFDTVDEWHGQDRFE